MSISTLVDDPEEDAWTLNLSGHPMHLCVYCLAPAEVKDHLYPKALGGGDGFDNLVPSCNACNCSKGSRQVEDWVVSLVRRSMAGDAKVRPNVAGRIDVLLAMGVLDHGDLYCYWEDEANTLVRRATEAAKLAIEFDESAVWPWR